MSIFCFEEKLPRATTIAIILRIKRDPLANYKAPIMLVLDDDDVDDDNDNEEKKCSNISQSLLYCSPRYTSTYTGTRKFLTKPLWISSHLKSDFFSEKKVLNEI